MMVRIVPPKVGKGPVSGLGTVVEADGREIPGITAVDIRIRPDDLITAVLTVVAAPEAFEAEAVLSEESMIAAEFWGYEVRKRDGR